MSDDLKLIRESLADISSGLGVQLRAAFSVGIAEDVGTREVESQVDPDFKRWLYNDCTVTGSPASRYRSQPPGYLTSNGRGSLEIGAADD